MLKKSLNEYAHTLPICKLRLENAKGEIRYGSEENGNFDLYVVNSTEGGFEATAELILRSLKEWFPNYTFVEGVEEREPEHMQQNLSS